LKNIDRIADYDIVNLSQRIIHDIYWGIDRYLGPQFRSLVKVEESLFGIVLAKPAALFVDARTPAASIYFPTTFRSASLILSCQPGPAS
jgi:hypothetical protein